VRPRLPEGARACLFDLDGVVTRTAVVHAAAWQEMLDAFLRGRAERTGEPFVPFDPVADYDLYADGLPRADGVRRFLASRGIRLPEGEPDDPPPAETVHGLGNRKNEIVLRRDAQPGRAVVFEDALAGVEAGRAGGFALVVGVHRLGQADALRAHGADVVVSDLAELIEQHA